MGTPKQLEQQLQAVEIDTYILFNQAADTQDVSVRRQLENQFTKKQKEIELLETQLFDAI